MSPVGVKLVVAVTDSDWFALLRAQPLLKEVNFWAPSDKSFRALQPGELFLFKLHAPVNKIVGGGIFAYATMMPLTEKELAKRDAKRDLGAELLQSVREMKARKGKVVARVEVPAVMHARMKSGLSQSQFAQLLGVRTLQDWEQGRRQPSGAARTLIVIAEQKPKMLLQVFKDMAGTS